MPAAFTAGNLVVERIGDGSTTLGSAAINVAVQEYSTGGSAAQTLTTQFTSTNLLTDSGTGTSNGYLNYYAGYLGVPGYNSALTTASVAGLNTKVTNILANDTTVAGRVTFPTGGPSATPPSPFSGNNFRSVIATGTNTFYASGTSTGTPNTGGIWYYGGSAFTQVSTTVTNTRNVEIYGGGLYFSTGSGTTGIYKVGSGLPTTGSQTATLQTGLTATSPYGFVLFDTDADGTMDTAYVADDGTTTGSGLKKFTYNTGTSSWTNTWSLLVNGSNALSATAATGYAGLRGLTGSYSGGTFTLYATTTETSNNRLIKITDSGSSTPSTATAVAAAGTNFVFRGVDLVTSTSPTITGGTNATAFTTTYGTASAAQSFIISGSNLTANLVATAPTGFEVSSDGTTYGSTATFTQSGGSANGTLRIRLAATAAVGGSYNSQNIVLSSTGATSVNITTASTGNTVTAKGLTISGLTANDKGYDGNTSVSVTGTPAYSGLVNNESFSVTGTVTWAFPDANVGANKTLTRTGNYDTPSGNYTLTQPTLNASITAVVPTSPTINSITPGNQQLSVAFTAPSSNGGATVTDYKYSLDGGSFVAVGSTASPFTINGLTNGQTYSVRILAVNSAGDGAASTAVNGTPAVPASPAVTVTGLSGSLATTYGNVSAEQTFTVSGSALTGNLSVSAPTGLEVSITSGSGFGNSLTLTATSGTVANTTIYVRLKATAAAGAYNNVSISITGGGDDKTVSTGSTGNSVSQAALTITGIAIADKAYDAGTTATITGTASYSGLVNGESFSVTGAPTAAFADKNVATGKSVTVGGYTAPSGNYSISQPTGLTASITPKALTLPDAAVTTKTYDTTTSAVITGTLTGVISGETVTLNGTGTFASANAGTGISVTSTSTLGGADASNYSLTQPTGLTGNINKANQTITFGALPNKMVTDAAFNLGATTTSGLTISYTSSNTSVATVSGNTITIVGIGTTTITASQTGDGNYNAASDVAQSFTVTRALVPGDILFTGMNSTNPDQFAFVALFDLPGGIPITFTDNAWTGSALATNEGTIVYTTPASGLPAGSRVVIQSNTTGSVLSGSGTVGNPSSNFALSTSGDNIFAYTGLSSNPTFLSGILTSVALTTGTTTTNLTYIPSTISGYTFQAVTTGTIANTQYTDTTTGTVSSLTTGLITRSSWTNSSSALALNTSNFTILQPQTITFNSLSNKTYGDSNFDLTATASSGLTVSYLSSDTSVATISGSTVTILKAGTTTITASQAGDSTYAAASSVNQTLTVNKKSLTVSSPTVASKVYDGTTTAGAVTVGTLSGFVGTETVTATANASAYLSADVGSYSTTVTYILANGSNGGLASNYSLANDAATGAITAKGLTVSGVTASDKVYNQTTTATLNTGSASLVGVVGSDDVTLVTSSVSGAFSDKNVGNGKTVTIAGLSLAGTKQGNYTLTQPTTTASITPLALTVTGFTANSKVYDGNTSATVNVAAPNISGILSPDEVFLNSSSPVGTFASTNVANGIAVTVSGLSLFGADASNYTLSPYTTPANITPKALSITAPSIASKVYDGTTTAGAVTVGTLSGFVGTETVTATGTAAAYSSANAGTYSGVTVTYTLANGTNGGLATNYSLANGSASGTITKANQSITWATPAAISLGTALSATQLNATAAGISGGSAPGALSYDSPIGTILPTGANSVTVTSAATVNYNQATRTVTVQVNAFYADPNPSTGNGFGTAIVTLTNGNVVITAPLDDFGGTDAGAVYLYSGATGALISTLVGSHTNDKIGSDGVLALSNGNFVIRSSFWDNGTATDAGAVTFGSAVTGVSGTVSSTNSLVGSTTDDHVGKYAITALKNGNYVVPSLDWDNGGITEAGAVTFGSGTSGISGVISSSNSLVGSHNNDKIGSVGITELSNGNYVARSDQWDGAKGAVTWGNGLTGTSGTVDASNSIVGSTANDLVGGGSVGILGNGNLVFTSPHWHNSGTTDSGAATWLNGTNGKTIQNAFGAVSASNSLVGSSGRSGDAVGLGGVTVLKNNNYVVVSANWNNVRGAATWGDGSLAVVGVVSDTNSLVGDVNGANVGSGGVTGLANSNYLVNSMNWSTNKGAVTFGNGLTGKTGTISSSTSLVGTVDNSYVGYSGVTELSQGNFIVGSSKWNNGTSASVGAATFGSGTSGITGVVSSSNSLVGSQANDQVGAKVTALKNGNYAVVSSTWANGTSSNAGAVTFGNGTSGVSGTISASNSLVGSSAADQLGSGGIKELSNGNFLVVSPLWNNNTTADAGAVTWVNGTNGLAGALSSSNSLVGTQTNDKVGGTSITVIPNGNYVVASSNWDNGTTVDAGAVTWGNGSTGTSGNVGSGNSFVGTSANDQVGSGGVTVLSNNHFVVSSPNWNNGTISLAGAVTWGNGSTGGSGAVSSTNSLVGTTANDQIGSGGVTALTGNGNYVIASPLWDSPTTTDVGAVTFVNGANGSTVGGLSSSNSLVGSTAGDKVGDGGVTALASGNYLVKSSFWNNGGSKANAGAVTLGLGTSGIIGSVSSTNSTVGSIADAGLQAVTLNVGNTGYLVRFLNAGSSPQVSFGYQNPTSPVFTSANNTTFTVGAAGSFTFTATGSPKPAFSLVSGNLPSGVTLNSVTGVLSGTPGTGSAGIYNLTIRATNGLGTFTDLAFTLTVA